MSGYVIDNSRNRAISPSASYNGNETVGAQTDAVYARKRRTAREVAGAQVSTGGGATVGEGGGTPGGVFEEWLWSVTANKSAGTPWTVTSANTGVGTLQGFALNVPAFGAMVQVGNIAIPQGTGAESYAHWVRTSSTTITIHNLHAVTADGGVAAKVVRIRALV